MVIAPRGAAAAPARTARRLLRLLSGIRFDEVLVLQGTPLLGALFAMGALSVPKCLDFMILTLSSCCLVAHVFLLNDLGGASTDINDPQRADRVFTARGIGTQAMATLCVAMLLISLLLLVPFGATPLLLAFAVALCSLLYSAPGFAMKGVPLVSSVLHLAGGVAHFLMGYAVFHALDERSLGIAGYFALMFAAGHLTHEARDSASDGYNGIRTNAVRFGTARNFIAGFVLFTLADLLLLGLAASAVVPRPLLLVGALYPLHAWWTWRAWRTGLEYASIWRLQQRYRMLYAVVGLAMALATRF